MEWKEKDNRLEKEFTAGDFAAIMEKLPELAKIADGMNHHPDFEVYGYKNIKFSLMTHSEGKITELDHNLAKEIDQLFTD